MRLGIRTDPTTTDRVEGVRRRRRLLGLGYALVPIAILLVFAVGEGIGGEAGWWGHLVQLVPLVGLAVVGWVWPRIGGPLLIAAAVALAAWLLVGSDGLGDAAGAMVLLCAPLGIAGVFFIAACTMED